MNNFAISSDGIGEALKRNAAAMAASGNTLEETIGLIVGMNSVLQNPEAVGTTLKTSTMYLRAAKTEAEEAGEATDGMANSVAELRDKLKDLSGVDIMIDDHTFKSTVQIYRELAAVYESLHETSQANILNLLGGKRNANAIQALLTNFDDVEAAIASAQNSFGSATLENQKYMESIQGRLDLLARTFENLSHTIIDSELFKGAVDFLTNILKLVNWLAENIGALPVVLGAMSVSLKTMGKSSGVLGTLGKAINILGNHMSSFVGKGKLMTTVFSGLVPVINKSGAAVSGFAKILSSNWIGLVITGISLVATFISNIKKANEEIRQQNIEKSNSAASEVQSYIDAYKQYLELGKQFESGEITRESYIDSVMQTADALGIEQAAVVKLIDSYGGLDKAIQSHTLEELDKKLVLIRQGVSDATENLLNQAKQTAELDRVQSQAGWWSFSGIGVPNPEHENNIAVVNALKEAGFDAEYYSTLGRFGASLNIQIDTSSAESIISAYNELSRAMQIAGELLGNPSGNDVYNAISSKFSELYEYVIALEQQYDNLNNTLATRAYLEVSQNREDPKTQEEYNAMRNELITLIDESAGFMTVFGDSAEAAADRILALNGVSVKFAANVSEGFSYAKANVAAASETISQSVTDATKSFDLLAKAQEEMKNSGSLSSETVQSIIGLLSEEEELSDFIEQENGVLKLNTKAWEDRSKKILEAQREELELAKAQLELDGQMDSEKYAEYSHAIELYDYLIKEATTSTEEAARAAYNLSDAYSKISGAVDSWGSLNSTTQITYDNYQKLIAIDSRYAHAIEYQNGILVMNERRRDAVTQAIMKQSLEEANAARQAILANEEYQDLLSRRGGLDSEEQKLLDKYNAEILAFTVLANEIDNATSAYQRFLAAGNEPVTSESYTAAKNAFKVINDTLFNKESDMYGKVGREQYQRAVTFVLGEEVEVNTKEFDRGIKLAERYLTENSEGVRNFYNDLLSTGLLKESENGFVSINATIDEMAEKLGINVEFVRAMIDELNTYQDDDSKKLKVTAYENSFEKAGKAVDEVVESAPTAKEQMALLNAEIDKAFEGLNAIAETPIVITANSALNVLGSISEWLGTIITKLNSIKRLSPLTVEIDKVESLSSSSGSSSTANTAGSRPFLENLFAFAGGTKKAKGGKTLIGELGAELVVDPHKGQWYLAGENGAQFVNLPEDAIVFNARQTSELLSFGRTNERGSAMASGTISDINKSILSLGKGPLNVNGLKKSADAAGEAIKTIAQNSLKTTSSVMQSAKDTFKKVVSESIARKASTSDKVTGAPELPPDSNGGKSGGGSSSGGTKEEVVDPLDEMKEYYDELNNQVEHLIEHQQFLFTQAEKRLDFNGMNASLKEQGVLYQKLMDQAQQGVDEMKAQGADDTSEQLQDLERVYWDAYKNLSDIFDQMNSLRVDALTEKIDGMQSAFESMAKAAEENARYGGITVDTFQQLLSNGVEYLSLLDKVNGQYVINESGINRIIAAEKERLAIETALSYVADLRNALEKGGVNAVAELVELSGQISDSAWSDVYAQAEKLKMLGLSADHYNTIINNLNAIESVAGNVITNITDDTEDAIEAAEEKFNLQKDALADLVELTKELIRYETEEKIEAINDEIDAYKQIIELRKEALGVAKDESKYEKDVADSVKEIAEMQARIDQLSLDTSREANAERTKLIDELNKLQEKLADVQSDHAYDAQIDALDKMADTYEQSRQPEIEQLEQSIGSAEKLQQAALDRIANGWSTLYTEMIAWNTEAGSSLNKEITETWKQATEAAREYGSYIEALRAFDGAEFKDGKYIRLTGNIPKYHSGGVVGDGYSRSREVIAKLENGEAVLDAAKVNSAYRIIDFYDELSAKLGAKISEFKSGGAQLLRNGLSGFVERNDRGNNTPIEIKNEVHISIEHNGELNESAAKSFGKKAASAALGSLREAFERKGITSIGNVQLAQ